MMVKGEEKFLHARNSNFRTDMVVNLMVHIRMRVRMVKGMVIKNNN